MLISPEGYHLQSAIHFAILATTNDVEYEVLIAGLEKCDTRKQGMWNMTVPFIV